MNALVCGIGVNERMYLSRDGRVNISEYKIWYSMLERCTIKYWSKHPTYVGVTCSENFKSYTFFYEWCNKQNGFNEKDENGMYWHLDKDILVKDNKVYSEDNCVFVPQRINNLLTKGNSRRGNYPIGVSWHKGTKKYMASCSFGKMKLQYLGLFATPQEAFLVYKTYKEALIKEVANEYKEVLDKRVYEALMKYEVNIND